MFTFAFAAGLFVGLIVCTAVVMWHTTKAAETAHDIRRRIEELNHEHVLTWHDFPDTASFEGEQDIQRQIDEMRQEVGDGCEIS